MGLDKCKGSIEATDDGQLIDIGVPASQCLAIPLPGGLITALHCTFTYYLQLPLDLALPLAQTFLFSLILCQFNLVSALSNAQADLRNLSEVGERRSGLWTLLQTPEDDTIELHRVGQFLRSGFLDEPDSFEFVAGSEGWLEGAKFIDEASQCPNICLLAADSAFDLLRRQVVCLGKNSRCQLLFPLQSLTEIEPSQFQILSGGLSEVDMSRVQIAMQDVIVMDILECLCQLVKDPPNFILGQSLSFRPGDSNQILECTSSAVLHDDIDGDVLLVDGVVEVPEDVDVVESYEGVDLVDDVLFAFGGEGAEGHFFQHDLSFGREGDGLVEIGGLLGDYLVAGLHSNDTFQIQQLQSTSQL